MRVFTLIAGVEILLDFDFQLSYHHAPLGEVHVLRKFALC